MAGPMTSAADTTPVYFVYRDIPAGEPFDPTSPLLFFPPKGSDELFDALRVAFPHLKTHSERMRDAIINFLLDERRDEQTHASPAPAAPPWPSVSSSASPSMLSSPEMPDLSTPAYSPQPAPQLARQASLATSSQHSPPSLDQMTNVFSLSSTAQPKQRVRRKMTEAEKVEYRKRRIVKACDKCAKRKRKCPHNQTQMDTIATSAKSGSRSSKSASPKSTPPASVKQVAKENFAQPDDLEGLTAEINMDQSFDDFPMFDDSFAEISVNDFLHFDNQNNACGPYELFTPDFSSSQYSWTSNGQDLPLIDSASADQLLQSDAGLMGMDIQAHPDMFDQSELVQQLPLESQLPRQSSPSSRVFSIPGVTAQQDRSIQQGSRVSRVVEMTGSLDSSQVSRTPELIASANGSRVTGVSEIAATSESGRVSTASLLTGQQDDSVRPAGKIAKNPQRVPSGGEALGSGNGMLWEHLRTGQLEKPQPTHTAHVHGAGCGELFSLAEQNGVLKEPFQRPTLPGAILRLVTTTRAVNAFAGLVKSKSNGQEASTRHLVSMQSVLPLVRHEHQHTDGIRDLVHSGLYPVLHTRPLQEAPALFDRAKRQSEIQREVNLYEEANSGGAENDIGRQELGQQTSTSVSHVPSGAKSSAALPKGGPQTTLSREGKVSISSRPAQGRKAGKTLGAGIDNLAGPSSSEMFMLRRRISRQDIQVKSEGHDVATGNPMSRRTWCIGHNDSLGSLSSPANGGAYPRLETNSPRGAFGKKASEIERAQGPASYSANRNEHPDRNRLAEAAQSAITKSSRGTIMQSDSKTIERNLAATGNFTYAVSVDKKRDTKREKDHFGRSEAKDYFGRMAIQAGLGFALLAVLANYVNASALLLAFLVPIIPTCVGYGHPFGIVQCSETNSAWLSNWHHLTADALKYGNGKGGERWTKGLMYPCTSSLANRSIVC
ncbi:hypothetical protein AC579_9526 [Pseudocercospora musae]|uniref:Uncharacterized protein n=1 Tax=Pseudocercospora musae TaxID=113226 RepID=A0A139I2M8_9PEZI|nr:hypothetical protein AC579_9526 [Pseudocercospora musae]